MLITITQATKQYATPRSTIVEAVNNGQLTRHQRGDRVLVDTGELDATFAPNAQSGEPASPDPVPVADPSPATADREPERASPPRRLPTPDELDAAVRQALESPWRRRPRTSHRL